MKLTQRLFIAQIQMTKKQSTNYLITGKITSLIDGLKSCLRIPLKRMNLGLIITSEYLY